MDSFTKNSKVSKAAYKIKIPLEIPSSPELIQKPATLGVYLRRRVDLGVYQKEVAAQIGVTASTIWNWEHGWTVDQGYISRVITFLGFNPFPCPEDTLERLACYKQVNGLNLEELGAKNGP